MGDREDRGGGYDPDTRAPRRRAPAGACDTHMHIFGPAATYPYNEPRDYTPRDSLMPAYRAMCRTLGVERTVVVQPSIYGGDHACTAQAVADLGAGGRGVAVLGPEAGEGEIERLHAAGFRGTRFNLVNRGGVAADALETVAAQVAEFGWHVQVMVSGPTLPDLAPRLAALPTAVVIDHMGRMDAAAGVAQPGFRALLALLEGGRCWVKLSGAYRTDLTGPPWPAARPFAAALIAANPERMLWGTDWPHPDLAGSPVPNDGALLDALADWVPDESTYARILVDNPARLYGFA